MDENTNKSKILLTTILVAIIIVATFIIVMFTLSAQNTEKNSKSYLTTNTIISQIIKKMNYENLSKISDENISKYYKITDGTVTDCAMYISNRADLGMELACFRLSSEDYEKSLMDSVSEYISSKDTENKEGSGQLAKIKTDIVYPYVFVAMTSNSEAAAKAFEEIINSK